MYGLTVTTAPASEPVSLADAKEHLRIASAQTDYDSLVSGLIVAARRYYEARTHRALIRRTLTFTTELFPIDWGPLYLPWSPLYSVTSVKYYDADGTQQTWSSSNYTAITNREPGGIALTYNGVWPAYRIQPQGIEVVYVAGHATSAGSSVPAEAVHCIKLLLTHWFENTSGVNVGPTPNQVPLAVESLIGASVVADEFMTYGRDLFAEDE